MKQQRYSLLALFIVAKGWTQPECPSEGEWHSHIMEYFGDTKNSGEYIYKNR